MSSEEEKSGEEKSHSQNAGEKKSHSQNAGEKKKPIAGMKSGKKKFQAQKSDNDEKSGEEKSHSQNAGEKKKPIAGMFHAQKSDNDEFHSQNAGEKKKPIAGMKSGEEKFHAEKSGNDESHSQNAGEKKKPIAGMKSGDEKNSGDDTKFFAKMVDCFADQLQRLPENMHKFSLSLRSLYVENAVGSTANIATGFNNIRDQTRQDAIVYVKGVMPLSTKVIRFIQEFFEYYEALELEEWTAFLPDILEDVTRYQQCCTEIIRKHEDMMQSLNTRHGEAKEIASMLGDFNKDFMKKKAKLGKEAVDSKVCPHGEPLIQFVESIVAPLLNQSVENDLAKSVADDQQLKINTVATMVVSDVLIPALANFLNGLNAVADFLNMMKKELTTFHCDGEQAVEGKKWRHYNIMKKKAVEIKTSCKTFYTMIPRVRTDLQCIPEKPGDLNYVDKWLIEQQEQIKEEIPSDAHIPVEKTAQAM